jgi:hypothetical protein
LSTSGAQEDSGRLSPSGAPLDTLPLSSLASEVSKLLPFVEDLDVSKVHVRAPTSVVFLCGGPTSSLSESTPLSIRDAFLKIADNPALKKDHQLILAEDVTVLSIFSSHYTDLLKFETDLAQITELIVLFCESEGSMAELGAFSMVGEIAERLLVIVRDRHWIANSFIKLGPLRALENQYGANSIYVLDDSDINIRGTLSANINIGVLRDRLQEPLTSRLKSIRQSTTFDRTKHGHIIKLSVGLIQEYGALTLEELGGALTLFGPECSETQLSSFLLCAEEVNWIKRIRKGSNTYYFARNLPDAATFTSKENAAEKNRVRRRLQIRDHWSATDALRDRGIKEVFGGRSS